MKNDSSAKQQRSVVQIEHEAAKVARARLTASLREQRLKRDAELAASGVVAVPAKRASKKKST